LNKCAANIHSRNPFVKGEGVFFEIILNIFFNFLQKTEDVMITEGLQQLSSSAHSFDFLNNEPDLYSSRK